VLFAIVQLASALWLYGRLPLPDAPPWLGSLHRISGRLAFLASLPVAYHCLYQLAFQDTDTRVLVHSLLGCTFYGAFAAKVVIVRSHSLPGAAAPARDGTQIFTAEGCGGCHTLADAGATGTSGPNLDELAPDA
jgi:hypothetical protein